MARRSFVKVDSGPLTDSARVKNSPTVIAVCPLTGELITPRPRQIAAAIKAGLRVGEQGCIANLQLLATGL